MRRSIKLIKREKKRRHELPITKMSAVKTLQTTRMNRLPRATLYNNSDCLDGLNQIFGRYKQPQLPQEETENLSHLHKDKL